VVVKGRVTGVGFRDWTASTAELLGLAGWVRNRRDGSVEALLSGDPAKIEVRARGRRPGSGGTGRVERLLGVGGGREEGIHDVRPRGGKRREMGVGRRRRGGWTASHGRRERLQEERRLGGFRGRGREENPSLIPC
jgi:hypothetical protein